MLTFITITYSQTQDVVWRPIILATILVANFVWLTAFSFGPVFAQKPALTNTFLLTEVFYDTPGVDSEQEWVELANLADKALDLSDYKLGDEEQSRGQEGMLRFPQQSTLSPGQIIVVAQSALAFRALYGRNPDFEIADSDPQVPDMRRYIRWSVGDFALANDGDELLLLDSQDQIIDSINYGDKTTYFSPAINSVYTGQSIARIPAGCDTDSAADWQPNRNPAPGLILLEGECSSSVNPGPADEDLLSIGQIQGAGDVSPFINQLVEFRGLVTGLLEDRNSAGITFYTIFVQDMPGFADGDPQTSDGLAVFLGRQQPKVQAGDLLHISGLVTEFYGLTEIDDQDLQISIESGSHALPEAVRLDLHHDAPTTTLYLESHESMLVAAPELARVVGPTHTGCGFALVNNSTDQDPNPRQSAEDSIPQPLLILHNSDIDCHDLPDLKKGDLITNVSGPLTYHFDQYKIVLQDPDDLVITSTPWLPPPKPFQPSSAQITVSSFNLNNHFDGIKDMPSSAEPVVSATTQAAKQKKLAAAIAETLGCPAIVALQEIENESLLHALAAETAVFCDFTYEISHRDSSDSRGLDLALLSDPRRISIDAVHLQQTCTSLDTGINDPDNLCSPAESPLFGRPPLQVDLHVADTPHTIIVNHFKSKRDGEDQTAARRLQQSAHVARLAADQQADDPQARIIVLGDFNDYERSPTLLQMTDKANLTNILERLPLQDRYSYIFDGIPQLLDGILVSPSLLPAVEGVMIIHANADYPAGLAFDTSARGLPYHASDHDLPLLLLGLPLSDRPITPTAHPVPKQPAAPHPTATAPKSPPPAQPAAASLPLWPALLIILVVLVVSLLYLKKV